MPTSRPRRVGRACGYCVCGGYFAVTMASLPPEVAVEGVRFLRRVFWLQHEGPGHGPTTQEIAARQRALREGGR